MAAITLEELLKEVGVCPKKLNESISDDHLCEIALFLTSWWTVASHLDLGENDLDDAEQGGRKVKDKSLKALQIWKGKFGFKATYKKLVEVLLSLAMADVAEKVCNLLKEGIPVHKTSIKLQSKSREHEEDDARSANDINTGLTDVLSKQPEFQQLSTSEQEELMVMLYDDEKSMKRQFWKLVVKTCDSIQKQIPVDEFAGSILALGAYDPAPGERNPALLDEHSEEIKRAGSISEIFKILSAYWNYLNYEILEDIIELYGTSDDAERLRNYSEELHKFCKRRSFELPTDSGNGNTLSPKQAKFRVKLNLRKDITYEQLLQIRGRIAKILKIRLAALVLSRVEEGCVQLLFLIPKFVAQEIFPLSQEQTSALCKDVSLMKLECGQYTFETCEMYTEDDNTVLKEMEDKSQLQTEPCVERQLQTTQTNQEPQTPGEGHELQLLEKKLEKTSLESLEHSAVPESVTISPNLKSSTVNPTTVTDHYWVSVKAPHTITSSFGKWLVFKQLEELDETWHMIRKAVESGQLGATGAKCSTAKPDPSSYPMDSNKGVICVYTSEEMMDKVGFDLVKMVKQDIWCKMDEATLQGKYRAKGYTDVSLQTIYWNDGDPYLKKYEEDKEGIPVHKTSIKLQSKLREHEEDDARSANDINTGLTDVLSKQPEFQQLSTSEQEELMVMLYDDEKSMKRQFCKLVVKTCDSIQKRIPVDEFAGSILALGAYDPAPGERNPALLDEHSEEIKRAGSISEIFKILSAYWNYLNYEILEDIIELYGTSDDAERLRNYSEELHKFCKRRSFELPPDSGNGNTLSPKQAKFRVKLNLRKDITYEQLLQIRGRIAKILKIRLAALVLSRVEEGCVQLLFLIPKFVAQEIFPLSQEQTSALCKAVSLIRLECESYTFETCEMYTEDDNTVLKEMQDKSQLQTEPCVERQLQTTQTQVQTTQTNQEPQTPGEGHELQLLEKKLEKTSLESLEHSAVPESVTISPNLKSSTVNPTTVTDHYWVSVKAPHTITSSFGKWLVFKQLEELDETWHMIRKAVESGKLDSTGAKCSTAKPDPSSYLMDSNKGVICVYTSEEMMDKVGFDLVKMVKQDIRYKTDEATLQGLYRARGYTNMSLQTIYWNDGDPYLKKYEEDKGGSWRGGRDQDDPTMRDWRQGMGDGERSPPPQDSQGGYHYHGRRGSSETDSDSEVFYVSSTVNPTTVTDAYWVWADGISSSQKTLGKWLVFKRFDKLDETWHMIQKAVESGQLGATGAKCSTAKDNSLRYPRNSNKGVICVYTSEETMDEVGFKLVHMVKQEIRYKTDEATLQGMYRATGYKKVTIKTIFWNDGEPDFTRKRCGEAKRYPKALAQRDWVDPSCLPTEPPYTVYLGNLSYECTEDDVLEFFERKNINVISVRLPVESGTDRLRGFRYAELENTQALMEALNLSGEPLRGRRVNVDIAGLKKAGHHSHNPYGDHGPPRRNDEGRYYHDPYGNRGPPRRYDEGSHYHDLYGDRGPPRRYDEGRHYHDRYGDHGPPRRYDEGSHYHDPYGDRGPPQRYDEGRHHHDPYGDHGPPQRYERGRHYRHPYGRDGYYAQQRSLEGHHERDRRRNELPKERPRLQLQPRTKPLEDTSGGRERGEGGRASSSIFGQAKPVDTAAREREIEERLLREKGEREERGDRSLRDEGGKRGGRRNESSHRERSDGRGRYDSTGGGEQGERSECSDQGERGDGDCPPHDGCQDTTKATGQRGRRRESHEGEERASELGRRRREASPTVK